MPKSRGEYVANYNRLRPDPYKGIVLRQTIVATLTSDGRVEETTVRRAGQTADTRQTNRDLGAKPPAGISWSVAGADRIVRTVETPQNIMIATVTVDGTTCKLDIKYSLKPGFKDYMFRRITDNSWAYFTEPMVQSTICSIREIERGKAAPSGVPAAPAPVTPAPADAPAEKKQ